jgi:uncharacterized protein with GYD domain
MPKYLFKASYSQEGLKGVVAKGGTSRREALEHLFESSGGKMESFYFAFGGTDVYTAGELPDNETASAVALTVNSGGAAAVETVVLLTPEEVDAAAKKSVDYTPPGQ